MARRVLTGDKEIEATLTALEDKAADKVAIAALGTGISIVAGMMKKMAPVGPTGNLRKNIGRRIVRGKTDGLMRGKAGVNVGKRKVAEKVAYSRGAGGNRAPHAHLVALGTGQRHRQTIGGKFSYITNPKEDQLSTGSMPSNPFIKAAYQQSQSKVAVKMRQRAAKALAKELAKVAR